DRGRKLNLPSSLPEGRAPVKLGVGRKRNRPPDTLCPRSGRGREPRPFTPRLPCTKEPDMHFFIGRRHGYAAIREGWGGECNGHGKHTAMGHYGAGPGEHRAGRCLAGTGNCAAYW